MSIKNYGPVKSLGLQHKGTETFRKKVERARKKKKAARKAKQKARRG